MSDNRKTGTVKFFNTEKAFGFIIDEESGDEIFVHKTGVKPGNSLKQDARVEYNIEQGKKGLSATSVELI